MPALKIGVAMSGGVDSTMAASLLMEKGCQVRGFFMRLPLSRQDALECRAREVVGQLGIALDVVDLRDTFTNQVIGYFTTCYQSGLTPNPCIFCNQVIKFGLLAQAMRAAGMERVATGHYARIVEMDGCRYIGRGLDAAKDQSYFLARLAGEQLGDLVFPLGGLTKEAMYARAVKLGFQFSGEESQDVCFLGAGLPAFLTNHGLGERRGPVVDTAGRVLGEHLGVWRYTIGQRRGLGLPDATPWYVTALDGPGNRVIVGKQEELWRQTCRLHDLRWVQKPLPLPWEGLVQLRSRHTAARARLNEAAPGTWELRFTEAQRAITPGQFAVLYEDERVIGSGIIAGDTMEDAA